MGFYLVFIQFCLVLPSFTEFWEDVVGRRRRRHQSQRRSSFTEIFVVVVVVVVAVVAVVANWSAANLAPPTSKRSNRKR